MTRFAGGTFARVAELPLEIEVYGLERLEAEVTRDFTRVTTLVRLRGQGEEGLGEDVTWYTEAHDREQAAGASRRLGGTWTLESFSEALDIEEPHKRWAYESAALDLALRQAGRSLADALGRTARPVTFVVSPGLGDPPSAEPLRRRLELYPQLRFKLDPGSGWTDDLVHELAATGTVDIVDYKAFYSDPDSPPPELALYRRVAEGFPGAWLEDPALTDETDEILRPHRDRITWDAPIHSVADVEGLAFPPRTLNVKPSRFGFLRELLDFYDYCAAREIGLYGGGMFELGAGRGQIQHLASLFNPDGPNDVAPGGYNEREPRPGLPSSPLPGASNEPGFR
jgi:L-alanine-DL-glutamate epimerase-like enolase superfamily enzyme